MSITLATNYTQFEKGFHYWGGYRLDDQQRTGLCGYWVKWSVCGACFRQIQVNPRTFVANRQQRQCYCLSNKSNHVRCIWGLWAFWSDLWKSLASDQLTDKLLTEVCRTHLLIIWEVLHGESLFVPVEHVAWIYYLEYQAEHSTSTNYS
jgi:hypothetical protein